MNQVRQELSKSNGVVRSNILIMFSSSLVMSGTLLKIGVRKEAMSKKKKNGGRVGSGENGRVV